MTSLDRRSEYARRDTQQAGAADQIIAGLRNGRVPNIAIAQLSNLLDDKLDTDAEIGSDKRKLIGRLTSDLEAAYGLHVGELVKEYRATADIRTQIARR